ncbi:Auxin-responsive protein SAUR62 [Linum grandiflorum]
MAKKWQRITAASKTGGRIRITLPKLKLIHLIDNNGDNSDQDEVKKGHFAVYTAVEERKRFVVPLEFLNVTIFIHLLKLSEEQLGLPSDGPITLPCDPSFLEYLIGLVENQRYSIPEDLEKALLSVSMGMTTTLHSSTSAGLEMVEMMNHHPNVIYGF